MPVFPCRSFERGPSRQPQLSLGDQRKPSRTRRQRAEEPPLPSFLSNQNVKCKLSCRNRLLPTVCLITP